MKTINMKTAAFFCRGFFLQKGYMDIVDFSFSWLSKIYYLFPLLFK